MMMLKGGLTHTSRLTATGAQTARVIGLGDLPVLATPAMLILVENAAMLAVAGELEEGQAMVGGHINSSHLEPGKVGAMVETMAILTKVDRRKLFFHVVARQDGEAVGEGDHLRFVADKQRFTQGWETDVFA